MFTRVRLSKKRAKDKGQQNAKAFAATGLLAWLYHFWQAAAECPLCQPFRY